LRAKDGSSLTSLSDARGSYHFSAPSPGVYTLRAEMAGYRDTSISSIVLGEQESKAINLTLDATKSSTPPASNAQPDFFDQPHFTVAGVTDPTNLGGHGSDVVVRNRDALAKDTAALRPPSAGNQPNSTAAQHHALAEANEKQGKPLEAVREFQRAAELDPSEANFFGWGSELLLHHAAEPAIEVFTKGNRLFPQSVRMLTALGAAWYAQGFYDRAAQRLCQASDLNPNDPEPYLFMGKMQAAEAAPSDAIEERLARFVKLRPDNPLANYDYAVSLWKRQRNSENTQQLNQVKSLLNKAIALDPTLGEAYLQLGILDSDQNDLAHAISAYGKAIEVNPQLEQAHFRLAQAYRQSGEISRAQAELKLYEQISKEKRDEFERQHRELQQFVYQLRDTTSPAPQ